MFDPDYDTPPECDPLSDGPAPELSDRWAGWEVRMGADFMDDDLPAEHPVFVWSRLNGVQVLCQGEAYSESDWLLFPPRPEQGSAAWMVRRLQQRIFDALPVEPATAANPAAQDRAISQRRKEEDLRHFAGRPVYDGL